MFTEILENFGNPTSFYQLMGWIALFFFVLSYQFKSPRHTTALYVPADICYAIHYFGLDSYSSMMITLGAMCRNICGAWGSDRLMKVVIIFYVIFAWCMILFLGETIYEIGAALGTTFMSVAIWFRDRFYVYRLLAIGHQISWMILFVSLGSYSGVLMICITFVSNIVGIMRYRFQKNPSENRDFISQDSIS